ncbi:MAG: CHRD domain-containing protein [Balneolaceae bacterium]
MKRSGISIFLFTVFMMGPLTAAHAQQTAEVYLAGYKQVPAVNSSGSGSVTVTVRSDTLSVEGRFGGLVSDYRSSSIHYGSERERGNQLFALSVQAGEDRRSGTFSKEENSFSLRPSLQDALEAGELYISIASDRYQRGEIRGQIPAMN